MIIISISIEVVTDNASIFSQFEASAKVAF